MTSPGTQHVYVHKCEKTVGGGWNRKEGTNIQVLGKGSAFGFLVNEKVATGEYGEELEGRKANEGIGDHEEVDAHAYFHRPLGLRDRKRSAHLTPTTANGAVQTCTKVGLV
jgi:hypothetical protein